MRFAPYRRADRGGFTLAEVLAAMVFMAIVIPVAVQALRVANLAGEVGLRKAAAARVAERVLNEWLVTGSAAGSSESGSVREGVLEFRWTIQTEQWPGGTMQLATALVTYTAQGQEYEVRLSTLYDNSTQ